MGKCNRTIETPSRRESVNWINFEVHFFDLTVLHRPLGLKYQVLKGICSILTNVEEF